MKTASLPDSAAPVRSQGLLVRLLQFIRRQAELLPAIGLAEGGDVDGARELVARAAKRHS